MDDSLGWNDLTDESVGELPLTGFPRHGNQARDFASPATKAEFVFVQPIEHGLPFPPEFA